MQPNQIVIIISVAFPCKCCAYPQHVMRNGQFTAKHAGHYSEVRQYECDNQCNVIQVLYVVYVYVFIIIITDSMITLPLAEVTSLRPP